MADEKDRLGDKLRDKEKAEEDRYFSERDRALLEKRKQERAGGAAESAVASMRCPKDSERLVSIDQHGVTVEECPKCGGLWFDKGEVEAVASRERDSWLGRLFYGPRR